MPTNYIMNTLLLTKVMYVKAFDSVLPVKVLMTVIDTIYTILTLEYKKLYCFTKHSKCFLIIALFHKRVEQ